MLKPCLSWVPSLNIQEGAKHWRTCHTINQWLFFIIIYLPKSDSKVQRHVTRALSLTSTDPPDPLEKHHASFLASDNNFSSVALGCIKCHLGQTPNVATSSCLFVMLSYQVCVITFLTAFTVSDGHCEGHGHIIIMYGWLLLRIWKNCHYHVFQIFVLRFIIYCPFSPRHINVSISINQCFLH